MNIVVIKIVEIEIVEKESATEETVKRIAANVKR